MGWPRTPDEWLADRSPEVFGMVVGLIITAVLAVTGCGTLVALARSYIAKPGPAAAMDSVQVRPAMVHFAMANCKPGAAAYDATILDLAARGLLAVSAQPTGLWLAYSEAGARNAGATKLAEYEQRVLDSMHGRLKNTGGAPFVVLAETCRVDVDGTWKPFEEKLADEARKRGVCRRRLPITPAFSTVAGITTVAVATFAALATYSRPHADLGHAILVGWFAWLGFTVAVALASWHDRLTTLGATLAARWTREQAALAANPAAWTLGAAAFAAQPALPAPPPGTAGSLQGATGWEDISADALQRRAFAAALSIPGAGIGPPGRPGKLGQVAIERPSDTRPARAWSSYTGSWRLVEIKSTTKSGFVGPFVVIGIAAFLGVFDSLPIIFAHEFASWELIIAAVAAVLAVIGVAGVLRVLAIPNRLTFDGQVIARWQESGDESSSVTPYFAVDDGEKAWVFSGQVTMEDVVRVTVNPRDGDLVNLEIIAHQRPETPVEVTKPMTSRPSEPLLSVVEVAEFIGPVSRTTAIPSLGGYGTVYRGGDGTLSLTVATGGVASFNTMISRNAGTPLPGVGDAAWVLNKDRTVIVRVGEQVAKITVSGHDVDRRPDLLAKAAAAVAARLSAQAASAGGTQAATWPGPGSPASPAW